MLFALIHNFPLVFCGHCSSVAKVLLTTAASVMQPPKSNKHTDNKVSPISSLLPLLIQFFVSIHLVLLMSTKRSGRSQEAFTNPLSSTHTFQQACSACFPRKGTFTRPIVVLQEIKMEAVALYASCNCFHSMIIASCLSFQLQVHMLLFTSQIWSTNASEMFCYVSERWVFRLSGPK